MGTTASGFIYPDAGYTSGVRQAIQDLADSAEDVIREAGIPRFADSAARDAAITAPVLGMKAVLTSDEITSRHNGTTWKAWESDWVSFAPTWSGLTVGSGTLNSYYRYLLGAVEVRGQFMYGSGSAVSGSIKITAPVAMSTTFYGAGKYQRLGIASIDDAGTAFWDGIAVSEASSTLITLAPLTVSATRVGYSATSATVPMTWTTNDTLSWNFTYKAA